MPEELNTETLLTEKKPQTPPEDSNRKRLVCDFCGSTLTPNGDVLKMGDRTKALRDAEEELATAKKEIASLKAKIAELDKKPGDKKPEQQDSSVTAVTAGKTRRRLPWQRKEQHGLRN